MEACRGRLVYTAEQRINPTIQTIRLAAAATVAAVPFVVQSTQAFSVPHTRNQFLGIFGRMLNLARSITVYIYVTTG